MKEMSDETLLELLGMQAKELLKNKLITEKLDKLESDEERYLWMAMASMYALNKVNK